MSFVMPLLMSATFATAVLLAWLVRKLALTHGLLDMPNARSSHHMPTPRGGGVAIVTASTVAFAALAILGKLDARVLLAMAGGLPVAIVGFIDDRRPLSPGLRLVTHFLSAIWAVAWLGGLPAIRLGDQLVSLGPVGYVVAVLGIVWVLNLFNFMDGIDAIATTEAIFIACAGALLEWRLRMSGAIAEAAWAFSCACLGFLVWNRPPARIFMGDVGSGYLGFVIAVFAIAAARTDSIALLVWLLLGGAFFVDASVTLLRRLLRRERLYDAHRSHAYQWLARRWRSHGRTTSAVMALNILWLLPCAYFAAARPEWAGWITLGALLPVALLALWVGAGRPENGSPAVEPVSSDGLL
jgi:Fuc2NAc and GlcNAc transferase